MNPNSFGVRTGIPVPSIHYMIGSGKRQTNPSSKVLEKIHAAFNNVNIDWILTGSGAMFIDGRTTANEPKTPYLSKDKGMPLYPDYAQAGALNGFADKEMKELPHYYVPGFQDCDLMVPVAGDSMYPDYTAGDIIICKRITQQTFIQWGHAHLVDTVQGLVLKILMPCKKNHDCVQFVSRNDKYPPFEIPQKEVKKIWIVKGKIKKNLL